MPEQLGLFDEVENTADLKQPEPELEEITYKRKKRNGKREDDLSGLPVETVESDLPELEQICSDCGGALHTMGHDVRKELKIIPVQVKVVEHRRTVYSCRHCESHNNHVPVVKAPMPEPVIKGSLASPSAVAHIMTQKYVMSVPLYRQEQAWLRDGISLSRQTMANWVIRCSEDLLEPLYEKMKSRLLTHEVLHADETVCQVLREPGKKANTNSYMWHYRTIATEALKRLGVLFHQEALWKDVPSDDRQELRLKKSKPLAESFFAWLDSLDVLLKSPMGVAINYAIGQQPWLMSFYLDGRCELSNNRAENSIRPFVIGRKNWLFCNTQKGARASSVVYSIIETAK